MSEMCCTRLAENTGRKNCQKLPSEHHPTTLFGYISATEACIDNRKKLDKQHHLIHMSRNIVNFGLLTAEIRWRVWGTPANFNGFRDLVSLGLLQRRRSTNINKTLQDVWLSPGLVCYIYIWGGALAP